MRWPRLFMTCELTDLRLLDTWGGGLIMTNKNSCMVLTEHFDPPWWLCWLLWWRDDNDDATTNSQCRNKLHFLPYVSTIFKVTFLPFPSLNQGHLFLQTTYFSCFEVRTFFRKVGKYQIMSCHIADDSNTVEYRTLSQHLVFVVCACLVQDKRVGCRHWMDVCSQVNAQAAKW